MALLAALSLSDAEERFLTRGMQLVLLGILLVGLVKRSPSIAVNAGGALLVSVLPALIRREVGLRLDIGIVMWLTAAALLHSIGIMGPYQQVWRGDYVTHALSASVITGIGYAVVSSLDRYSDGVHLPDPSLTLFLFLLVVAVGLLWEVLEFAVTKLGAALGTKPVLIIFGLADILTDLVFTVIGGLLVALWGRRYFRDLVRMLGRLFLRRAPE